MDNIIRAYPSILESLYYPKRYPKEIFEKRDEILEKKKDRYNKYKSGINPDTGRKINKEGRLYNKLKEEFIINHLYHNVYLGDIEYLNFNDYNIETLKLNKEIDDKNMVITNENKIIESVIEKINNLEEWTEYIEYNGKKYGLSKYYNGKHRENNCMGAFFLKNKYTEIYSNDRPFMSVERETVYYNYECNKCKCSYTVTGDPENSISGMNYYKSHNKPKYW